MLSGTQIFGERGSFSITPLVDTETTSFITLARVFTKNELSEWRASAPSADFRKREQKAAESILTAYAPVTGVQIKQSVDYSLTKGLSKDFLIYAFGDSIVTLTLNGVNFYNITECTEDMLGSNKDSVMKFYKENKISTDITRRIKVSIVEPGGGAHVFKCALIGLTITNSSENPLSGSAYSYQIDMIGVAE